MKKAWAVLVVLCGFAHATNYYVRTDGSDANNGLTNSAGGAKLTPNGANAVATNPGDKVHVQPGPNYPPLTATHAGTAGSCSNTTGVSTSCITFICDTKWSCKIRPQITSTADYVRFEGFDVDGTLSGNVCCGFDTTGTTGNQIVNNNIHDTASVGNTTNNCVICVDAGAVGGGHHLIKGNFIHHNNGGAAGSTPNNGGQHGIYSELAGDVVQDNIVVDQGGGWCIESWHKVTNWTVTNNLTANCPNGGIELGDDTSTGVLHQNDTISNNIFINSGNSTTGNGGINFRQCAAGSTNLIQNNLMYGNTPGDVVGTCGSSPVTGTQTGTNATTFVNYTGSNPNTADFHLKTGSNAIANGTTNCAIAGCIATADFDGIAMSSPPPIGAYTFVSGSAPAPPTGFTATVR